MAQRIGIIGGTFDPIHFGHLAIAEEARMALSLDRLLFVPAAYQPLKANQPGASAEHRLEMVQRACATNSAFAASDIELARPGPSYTVTTLQVLRETLSGELFFVLGADALSDLPRWREAARIPELAHLVAVQRPRSTVALAPLLQALPVLDGRLTQLEGPQLDISSSELRQRIAGGRPIRYLTPDAVAEYIAKHQLYK